MLTGDQAKVQIASLAAEFRVPHRDFSFQFARDGAVFTVRAVPLRSAPLLELEAAWRPPFRGPERSLVRVTPEGVAQRLAVRIGLNAKERTGDAAFDGAVFVASKVTPSIVPTLFGPAAREAVLALMATGWQLVDVTNKNVIVQRVGLADPSAMRLVVAALDHVAAIEAAARAARAVLPESVPRTVGERVILPSVAVGFACFVSLLRWAAFPFLPEAWPLLTSFALGALAASVAVVAAALALRGRSTSLTDTLAWAVAAWALLPIASAAVLPTVDVNLDRSEGVAEKATLVDVDHPRKGTMKLTFRREADGEPIVLDDTHWNLRRVVGTPVVLRVRSGRLGWAWVEHIAEDDPPAP
jgi:hypothetical protein